MDVKNSSFDVEFNFTFDLITLHFVAAKTGPNTRFYGDKILHKNLKFFDKISVPTFCRRRCCNALYGEKILSMGKCYAGEIQNLNCRRMEMAMYFFLTRG